MFLLLRRPSSTTLAAAAAARASSASSSSSSSILSLSRQIRLQERRATMATSAQNAAPHRRQLRLDTINPHVVTMEYAVRGPIVIRAVALEKQLKEGAKLPFTSVIKANIGDAHAMGQRPITFIRQLLRCFVDDSQLNDPTVPDDVKQRVKALLADCGGQSAGSYSQSTGLDIIRKHVAEFIERRDGFPSDPESILLSGGASESIRNVLKLFVNKAESGKPTGIMIPIPQYPLYSASVEEFGLTQVGYYLDESKNWSLSVDELERSFKEASQSCEPRAIVVINPGNPTGQVLSRRNIEEIIKFAHQKSLFIFADEVYQDNVYGEGCAFHSFKKVLRELGAPYDKEIELASFHSVSKGYMGECGLRGGYVELVNLDEEVFTHFKKMVSAKLCSTVLGQAVIDAVVNPPRQGEPSYDLWLKEKTAVLESLKQRATLVKEAYGSMPGITCNQVQGAMYAFPRVHLTKKAIAAAEAAKQKPDVYYCTQLLENQGVCVVPGSGFCQQPGTFHFRTTILPQPPLMKEMLERFGRFHAEFMKKHAD